MSTPSTRPTSAPPPSTLAPPAARNAATEAATIFRLPEITSTNATSAAARDAWRVFVEQSAGWGKAELVLWSYGLYAPAARFSPVAEKDGVALENLFKSVDARFASRIVKTTRSRVLGELASFAQPGRARAFAERLQAEGAVTRCIDAHGCVAYIPSPNARSFVDRVLALVAADVLSNPQDFAGAVMCEACKGVTVGQRRCCDGVIADAS